MLEFCLHLSIKVILTGFLFLVHQFEVEIVGNQKFLYLVVRLFPPGDHLLGSELFDFIIICKRSPRLTSIRSLPPMYFKDSFALVGRKMVGLNLQDSVGMKAPEVVRFLLLGLGFGDSLFCGEGFFAFTAVDGNLIHFWYGFTKKKLIFMLTNQIGIFCSMGHSNNQKSSCG